MSGEWHIQIISNKSLLNFAILHSNSLNKTKENTKISKPYSPILHLCFQQFANPNKSSVSIQIVGMTLHVV